MFRDVYKSANDDIIPDSQLLDKILTQAPEKKKTIYPFFVKYGSVAAAFLILAGTLAIYPKLSKTLNTADDKAVPGTDVVTGISETASPEALPNLKESKAKATQEASTNTKNTEEAITEKDLTQQGNGEQITKEKTLPEVTTSPSPTKNATRKTEADGAVITTTAQPEISEDSVAVAKETNLNSAENIPTIVSSEDMEATLIASPENQTEPSAQVVSEEPIAPASVAGSDSEGYSARKIPDYDSSGSKCGGGGSISSASSGGSKSGGAASSGGSGGGAASGTTKSAEITESKAIELANEAFLQDFGEEFLNSSKIKTEFQGKYIITRYNENVTYTVTVTTDGLLKKQY